MKTTLTTGIFAYNEAANIGMLLAALDKQKIDSANLAETIVVSDASTDGTDEIVRASKNPKVRLIRLEKRRGAAHAQNVIADNTESDILVLLDGDILPENDAFIEGLIKPIVQDRQVGLTSAALIPAPPRTFVERVLSRNHLWKKRLFMSIRDGNNIYTCFGPARGFSRDLYSAFRYPDNIPYDAAAYMFSRANNTRFVSVHHPRAIFRCPSTIRDHVKQSSRFASGKKPLIETFGDDAREAYAIPRSSMLKAIAKELFFHPVLSASYLILWLFARSKKMYAFTSSWDISPSSKKI